MSAWRYQAEGAQRLATNEIKTKTRMWVDAQRDGRRAEYR